MRGSGTYGDAQGDIVAQGHTEEQRFLGHVDDGIAQVGQFDVPQVVAVDRDPPFGGVVDAPQQADQHRLARTGRPDDAQRRARRDVQIDVAQRPAFLILGPDAHIFQADVTGPI